MKNIKDLQPKKILIRSTNWIGDAVMTMPAVRTIRQNFPDSEITLLAMPWVADVFRGSPDVDAIISYDKKEQYRGRINGPIKLARDLKKRNFDAAILLQNAFEAAFIAWWAAIPVRAGFKRDGRGILLTHGVHLTRELRRKHQVHYYQEMLARLGLTPGSDELCLSVPADMQKWARDVIVSRIKEGVCSNSDGNSCKCTGSDALEQKQTEIPVIGFNPGAAYGPAKRWPVEKFSQLAAIIARDYGDTGCIIPVFGTTDDTAGARAMQEFSNRTNCHVMDMTGKTTLAQVIALIQCCDAFVTNDSGLMHVAAGLQVPTVAIFGSTSHVETGPFSENSVVIRREMDCSPCLKSDCPRKDNQLQCLEDITSLEVYDAVAKILQS